RTTDVVGLNIDGKRHLDIEHVRAHGDADDWPARCARRLGGHEVERHVLVAATYFEDDVIAHRVTRGDLCQRIRGRDWLSVDADYDVADLQDPLGGHRVEHAL